MSVVTKIVFSDESLVHYDQTWPGVPLILLDGLLEPHASHWVLDMKMRGYAGNTLISYAKSMALWLAALKVNGMTWQLAGQSAAERFLAVLIREGAKGSTARLRMIHIQEFYRWACSKEYIQKVPFHLAGKRGGQACVAETSPVVKTLSSSRRSVRAQSKGDFDKVLAHSSRKKTAVALRDELIAEAARYLGLRRSEVADLRVDQFIGLDPKAEVHAIQIKSAKSQSLDTVLVPRLYVKKVQNFIEIQRAAAVRAFKNKDPNYEPPPNVFLTDRGKRKGQAVTGNYIGDSWRRSAVQAGLDSRFHDNRSSFATNAAKAAREAGADARVVVKELLRHKSEKTSEVYVEYDKMKSDELLRARIVNDGMGEKGEGK